MTPRRRDLRNAVRRSTARLRAMPNVTHVTLGEKLVAGRPSGEISLKVYVEEKGGVAADDAVPAWVEVLDGRGRNIGRLRTDVVETGSAPEAFGVRAGHVLQAFDDDLGIAGVSFVKGGVGYVLTNAHVACNVAQNGASGPLRWRRSDGLTTLGPVISWSPLKPGAVATADAAVIRVEDVAHIDPLGIDGQSDPLSRMDVIRPEPLDYWFMANGERFVCGAAEPADGDNEAIVDGVRIAYRGFWQLKLSQGLARRGLSGSLICRTVDGRHSACGLLFGGVIPGYVWAYPFRPLYERIFASLPGAP